VLCASRSSDYVSVTMRRKPVRRDEVRFNGRTITTAPVDAVGAYEWGHPAGVILRLWAPMLRELNHAQRKEWESYAEARKKFAGSGTGAPEPITLPGSYELTMAPAPCRQCGRRFWRNHRSANGAFCSDHCAAFARRGKYAATRSKERAAARSSRRCENEACGRPIEAERSTKRFCSVRCRVAAFRGA
jgi:endogenous inhibitor of DNA gyrase (YacG/DUF329 family)